MTSAPDACTLPDTQSEKARAFDALHHDGVLVLPNAWDVASAVLIRDAGARAVATTSAGASWSLGAPDGERLSRDRSVDLVARITCLVNEPVAATTLAFLEAGASGINLEDSGGAPLRDRQEQAERISAVRATADAAHVPLFINARTDTYLLQAGEPGERFAETVRRAEVYLAAGADGIFVPGLFDVETIRRLTSTIAAPINIMAGPGAPFVAQLEDLGVRRVSIGMALAQAAYAHTRRAAAELPTGGTYTSLVGGVEYQTLNSALSGTTPVPPADE